MSAYPSIDTEVLRTFVAIADQGGFTRAGELVNRTQSAVSMQMKQIEAYLGQPLFDRSGHAIRPTPLAHEVAAAMRALSSGRRARAPSLP